MTALRPTLAALVTALALALGGCSTHDDRFADKGPPRAAELADLRSASEVLLQDGSKNLLSASPDALSDYTEAAVSHYEATQAPGARKLVTAFADGLLDAQVVADGSKGVASSTTGRTNRVATLRAGLAFLAAYEATGDERYAAIARAYATLVPTAQFGWHRTGDAAGIRPPGSKGDSIVATALAGAFLAESARVLRTDTKDEANEALKRVIDEQAAVGRWYSDTSSQRAMTLDEWATTLYALHRSRDKEAEGYLGGGIPAIAKATYTAAGEPINEDVAADGVGLGHAMTLLSDYVDAQISGPVFRAALGDSGDFTKHRSDDIDVEAATARGIAAGFLYESKRLARK